MERTWRILFIRIALVAILIAFVVYVIFTYQKYSLKNSVEEHLISEGYLKDEIVSITTHVGKLPVFSARVIFADEKDTTYYYRRDNNEVMQFGYPTDLNGKRTSEPKHMDSRLRASFD